MNRFLAELKSAISDVERVHDQRPLIEVARAALSAAPPGPLVVVTTSIEGVALAGAICAMRQGDQTSWQLIDLTSQHGGDRPGSVLVVEPIDPGAGWFDAVRTRFPGAVVFVGVNGLMAAEAA